MTIVFVGIDLAKNVFAIHAVNTAGKTEMALPNVPGTKLHELIAALLACTIGMEVCSGAHHWARRSRMLGSHASRQPACAPAAPSAVNPPKFN